MIKPSYCLDVFVGYDEHFRDALFDFLKGIADEFEVSTVQRGRMDDVKSVRIVTPQGDALKYHICENVRTGDDNDYEIHESEVDAQRSMSFMPDYNHPLGYKPFSIKT